MMPHASLTTDRLKLRPISLSDAPALQRHFVRWEITRNLSATVPWPYPEDGAYTFIRDTILPGAGCYAPLNCRIALQRSCPQSFQRECRPLTSKDAMVGSQANYQRARS